MEDTLIFDKLSGKLRKTSDIDAAEYILGLRQTKDPWIVIEELIRLWLSRSPEDFQGFKVHIKDIRETRLDPKFGQTANKRQERRLIIVFPLALQNFIRSLYSAEELPFDQEFFSTFGQKFKMFLIPEKI